MEDEEMFNDLPKTILSYMLSLLKCLNLPTRKGNWSRVTFYLIFFNMVFMQFGQIWFLVRNIRDYVMVAMCFITVCTSLEGFIRLISLYWSSKNIKKMFRTAFAEFWPVSVADSKTYNQLNRLVKFAFIFIITYFILVAVISFFLQMTPLYLGKRELPLLAYYPFDWQTSPGYEILFVWQWMLNFYSVPFVICLYDSIFITIMTNLLVQFKLVQFALRTIGTQNESNLRNVLSNYSYSSNRERNDDHLLVICVKHHLKLLKFADVIEETFMLINYLQFVMSTSGLCVGLLVTKLVDEVQISRQLFMAGFLSQLFSYCFMGQQLINESIQVSDAAFESAWHLTNCSSVRKSLMLIIQRAQRSKKITVLGLMDLNLESFLGVVKLSFSFYTLMQTLTEKQSK